MDNEWHGETHTLIVRSASPPASQFDNWHLDYDIEHNASCGVRDMGGYDDYDCDIALAIDGSGLEFCLEYSGTPVTKPGTYKVRGWGRKYPGGPWGPAEYDASIGIVDESEE